MTATHAPYKAPNPGRTRMELQDVQQEWVDKFPESETRQDLWEKFNTYLARFAEFEELLQNGGLLDASESFVKYVWIGGSFVSDKENPNNLDLTVFINGNIAEKIKGQEGSGWVNRHAFSRKELGKKDHEFYGLTPIKVLYYPVEQIFHPKDCTENEIEYMIDRGRWDDWLQRKRDDNTREITVSSCETRRGYVEVQL